MPTRHFFSGYLFEKLRDTASSICLSSIKETDLESKITVGLYLRLFLERFLVKNYFDKTGNAPTGLNQYSLTRDLIDISKTNNYLNADEMNMVEEINIVCPPYIHVNSFMYEPLIDVCGDDLIKLFNLLNTANQKWPL